MKQNNDLNTYLLPICNCFAIQVCFKEVIEMCIEKPLPLLPKSQITGACFDLLVELVKSSSSSCPDGFASSLISEKYVKIEQLDFSVKIKIQAVY